MNAEFGPAGNSASFFEKRFALGDVPEYILEKGLDVYEYQCGRGVKIKTENAAAFGALCAEKGVGLSIHAPYYISLSGAEERVRLGSIRYVRESAIAIKAMGGRRIVLHSGSCGKFSRQEALALAKQTMLLIIDMMDNEGFSQLTLCPETMGKINQLGTLEEVLELCSLDERIYPCIDFGHLNARTHGGIKTEEDYVAILDAVANRLGAQRAGAFHSHFSRIEYGEGGERRHLTFADTQYGPDYRPLLKLVAQRGLAPTFICESDETQAEDAAEMKKYYLSLLGEEQK